MPFIETSQLTVLSTAQSAHTTATLIPNPTGMAVLHQFSASLRTNLRTCLWSAPRHLIIPKKRILRATLLFMLPEIIRTPAVVTSTARTAATA